MVSRWGDELYFPLDAAGLAALEPATDSVNIGDIGFSQSGSCLCVFFGPTPASKIGLPVPESPVVVIGKTLASPDELRQIQAGERISVCLEPAPAAAAVAAPKAAPPERKLSQSEIDELVKQLLAEKQKQQGR